MSENGHHTRMIKAPGRRNSGAFVMPAPAVRAAQVGAHFRGVGEHPQPYGGRTHNPQEAAMPDTTPELAWTAEQLTAAQQAAVRWAATAEQTALEAASNDDYADDRASKPFMIDAVADARRKAQTYRSRSAEASRMAEMWSRVATALALSTSGQPAAYDLTVQLDPKHAGEELARHVHDVQRTTRSLGTR